MCPGNGENPGENVWANAARRREAGRRAAGRFRGAITVKIAMEVIDMSIGNKKEATSDIRDKHERRYQGRRNL